MDDHVRRAKLIELGLDVPLFIASVASVGVGTLSGEFGVWRYLAWKRAVPYWIKVGHAHLTWWSMFLVLASLLLPGVGLAPWAKTTVVVLAFVFPAAWLGAMYAYYEKGGSLISEVLMPVMEAIGFGSLLVVFLAASGIQLPLLSAAPPPPPSSLQILSGVQVPGSIFLIPAAITSFGVGAAWVIAFLFYRVSPHKPIRPAALVQLHNHTAMLAGSAVMMLMVLSILGVPQAVFDAGLALAVAALPLLAAGLLAFVLLRTHSIFWIAPTAVFYILVVLAFLAAVGVVPTDPAASGVVVSEGFSALRVSLSIALALILITSAIGPYLGLKWDTSADLTVTYVQPEGKPYPGPYPESYAGTQPVAGTPRGLENAHLSPGSWLHIIISWLVMLILVGDVMLGSTLHAPGLVYLFAITIPLAPIFNLDGRILAWRNVPYGIGSLYFAAHPVKGFNIVSLFIVGLAVVYAMSV